MRRRKNPGILVALIGCMGVILAALISAVSENLVGKTHKTESIPTAPGRSSARLQGSIVNRSGSVLSDVSVSIRNGPEARSDTQGRFVLSNAPIGDQMIVVKPPSGSGELTQNVRLEDGQTTQVNIVYDAATSRLGLLSITAPVDDSSLEVRQINGKHQVSVYGRCDGLTQLLGNFDVWVLVKPESDNSFWVQHPPAIIDLNSNTWRADIALGDAKNPPQNGEHWTLVAIAADSLSNMSRIVSAPRLSLLPPHLASNVVTITSELTRAP